MNKLILLSMLLLPASAYAQQDLPDPETPQAVHDPRAEALDGADVVQRPDAQRVISDLSAALRLSSKQEDRINSAIQKKTAEFDKLMREYERNSAEEKSWRSKMYQNRYEMLKINRDLPDLVRDLLDDDQRQTFDQMTEARRKPAPAAAPAPAAEPAVAAAPAADGSAKPVKRRRLVRRKKMVSPSAPAAAPGAAPAAAPAADDEAGQTMVDSDTSAAPKAAPKKRRVLRKVAKQAPAAAPAAGPAAEDDVSAGPAGSAPTGQQPSGDDADAGSYP